MPDKHLLSIGEVARSLDITRRMILNYEDKGIVQPDIKEEPGGNRYYTTDTLTRIRTVRVLQNLGLSLDEIRGYFDGTYDLQKMIDRLEHIRHTLDLNIEKLKERVNSAGKPEIRQMTLPAQTIYCKTLRAETIEIRKTHLRSVIPDAMRRFVSDTSKRMYFIEYPLSDPNLISYCVAVSGDSTGEGIRQLPQTRALCLFYHGSYESIPTARERLIAAAREQGFPLTGFCRHIYLEGPAQHREEKDFITQVAVF